MNERHRVPEHAGPWLLVDELDARAGQPAELGGHVVDLERDVVHPRAAAREELADRGIGAARGDQLDPRVADLEQDGVGVGERVAGHRHGAEQLLVERLRRAEVVDRDADVIDALHRHPAVRLSVRPSF
jgi:hypothetical protein